MILLRSVLFVPGNNMRMIAKAVTVPADAIIFDLEDAVPMTDKTTARIMVRDSIGVFETAGHNVLVRLNALSTNITEEDIKFVAIKGLNGVVLAKTESSSDITALQSMLEKVEREKGLEIGSISIIPQLESAKGIINAYDIATAAERVIGVAFGSGDYYRDLGRSVGSWSPDQIELLYARCHIVNASVAAGVQPIDTVFFGLLTDKEGFIRETRMVMRLGFKGKLLIHPSQIEAANEILSPSSEETEHARRLVAAFEEAQEKGLGAISFEGKMVDYMNYTQAKELVEQDELVHANEERRLKSDDSRLFRFFIGH